MSDDLLLSIDAGTGGGRAVVFDSSGNIKARSYRAWRYYIPEGLEMVYGQEFDPGNFWELLCQCTREVVDKVDVASIRAVTSTSMRQGCLFLDKDDNYLYGGPNRDVRGILYSMEMEELLGEERAYAITGRWPPWIFIPSRLRWFKEENPQVYERIRLILMVNDWILYMLSGEAVGEPTNASESMLYDIKEKRWSDEMLKIMELDPQVLPRVGLPGDVIGEVTEKAAAQTGIPRGTPVVVGGADSQAALVACAQTGHAELGMIAGTTIPIMISYNESFLDPERRLWTHCHMFDDLWIIESQGGDAGKVLKGYVEGHFGAAGAPRDERYEKLMKLAEGVPPGSNGARAFLGCMIWNLRQVNPSKPGALLFPFPVEEESASAGNIGRAILESIAYACKGNMDQIVKATGREPESVAIAGGLTRSDFFNKIVASVLNRTCKVSSCIEATALGAAMAAAVGAGIYPDLKAAARAMASFKPDVEPDEDWAEEYEGHYEIWKENYDFLETDWS
jgi:autoinducer 2 (AI-2) kinase